MLLQLFSGLSSVVTAEKAVTSENLRTLVTNVKEELERSEALFNMAEDDALIDTMIYQQNSLSAYQQYLFHLIRENGLEDAESFMTEAIQPNTAREEGLAMG